jgi:hypothetical protein
MKFDINKIMEEYGDSDFGFSTESEAEFQAVIAEKDDTVEEYKSRLEQVEKIVMPFLTNLYKTRNQELIRWPNRGPVLEEQMQRILKLTRG